MFYCSECFHQFETVTHKCNNCGKWNCIIEGNAPKSSAWVKSTEIQLLKDIGSPNIVKLPSGTQELDRVLDGGYVIGGCYLIGGPPGVGKSTLSLQNACDITTMELEDGEEPYKVLYVSAEELLEQIKVRAKRISPEATNVALINQSNIQTIEEKVIEYDPDFLIVDSISTVFDPDFDAQVGSIGQVKASAIRLNHLAKSRGIVVILVAHITKDGEIAGPKALEHLVDAVLSFENERSSQIRTLRAIKHRFGPTNEIGIFKMENGGLKSVVNPINLSELDAEGVALGVIQKGSRSILLEFQTLIGTSESLNPKITVSGIPSSKRIYQLIAILSARAGINLHKKDIFLNIPGGLEIDDPGADLPITMAMVSNFLDTCLPTSTAFIGEIGLSGEIREVENITSRIYQAKAMGVETIIGPKIDQKYEGYVEVSNLESILEAIFERKNTKTKKRGKKPLARAKN
jgi:DNA repair protein RadA/Sms